MEQPKELPALKDAKRSSSSPAAPKEAMSRTDPDWRWCMNGRQLLQSGNVIHADRALVAAIQHERWKGNLFLLATPETSLLLSTAPTIGGLACSQPTALIRECGAAPWHERRGLAPSLKGSAECFTTTAEPETSHDPE
eukprot:CAMPEP_0197665360 /NCGR_PEP_ID=MMETSP1338-20131121/59179_1 /TAXON_ID=43686 ORGANISM="Pelagodinium beii, Strain RCC1491" /NCGR_SAMPLE_ID=MMETSP1338 /ASSEMBLY_ACC=CAM_ASM_000754 /LENGTH=137 /DNA_ID=CAMNT_0043244145 /DNA_START=50 /DNA_END=461 /DNA_ORIENTATION=-